MVLAVAIVTDLYNRRIPNWLVFPFLVAGVAISPWRRDWEGVGQGFWQSSGHGFSWHGLGQSSAGLALGFLIFGIGFWKGAMGAGDVKLAAAIGAWVGPAQMFWAAFLAAMAGAIMILCWMAYRKIFKRLLQGAADLVFGGKRSGTGSHSENSVAHLLKRKMPYAPAIAIGTFMSFFAHP
jgi:prepilin peptidase CpaA